MNTTTMTVVKVYYTNRRGAGVVKVCHTETEMVQAIMICARQRVRARALLNGDENAKVGEVWKQEGKWWWYYDGDVFKS